MTNQEATPPVSIPLWQQVKVYEERALQMAEQLRADQQVIEQLYKRIRALEAVVAQKVLVAAGEQETKNADQGSVPEG